MFFSFRSAFTNLSIFDCVHKSLFRPVGIFFDSISDILYFLCLTWFLPPCLVSRTVPEVAFKMRTQRKNMHAIANTIENANKTEKNGRTNGSTANLRVFVPLLLQCFPCADVVVVKMHTSKCTAASVLDLPQVNLRMVIFFEQSRFS